MPPKLKVDLAPSTMKELKDTLWKAADKLRGSMDASQYKDVILGLVFLKYISDRFEARRAAIDASLSDPTSKDYIPNETRRAPCLEDRDEYASQKVFWVPAKVRWATIQASAKPTGHGKDNTPDQNQSGKGEHR